MISYIFVSSFILMLLLLVLSIVYRIKLRISIKTNYPQIYVKLYGDNLLNSSKTIKLFLFIHLKEERSKMNIYDDKLLVILRVLNQIEKLYFLSFLVTCITFVLLIT